MTKDIAIEGEVPLLGADWFDPLEGWGSPAHPELH